MWHLKNIFSIALLFSLTGCGGDVKTNDRPDWIDDPGTNTIGKCGTHVRGRAAQEQCAYKKGLTYLAMSKGVSIDLAAETTMQQSSSGNAGTSYGQVKANVKIQEDNIKISAEIIDKWHDTQSDVMYVLIKEN